MEKQKKVRGNPSKIIGKGFDKFPEHINKNGRPKGKSLSLILKELIELQAPDMVTNNEYILEYIDKYVKGKKITHSEAIALKLIHNAEVLGDIRSIIEIFDRTEGKVKNETDITSGGEKIQNTVIKWGDNEIKI